MAFFNEFGRKITRTGQSAVQKTRNMADISRLNSLISEQDQSMSAAYGRIGELYTQLHAENYESEFADDMRLVAQCKTKIAELRTRIMELKGTVLCESCGSEIPASASYCENCGARQRAAVETVACPGCGQTIPAESRFCSFCGKPITGLNSEEEEEIL